MAPLSIFLSLLAFAISITALIIALRAPAQMVEGLPFRKAMVKSGRFPFRSVLVPCRERLSCCVKSHPD